MSIGGSKGSASRPESGLTESKAGTASSKDLRFRRRSLRIICTGLLSWLLLSVYRSAIVDPQTTFPGLLGAIPKGLASSYYDLIVVTSLTVVTLILLFLAKASRLGSAIVVFLFYVAVVVCLGWGFANINLVKMLGEPFTFQWLVYGDFLQNADARNAMGDALNIKDFATLSGSVILVLILGYAAASLCRRLSAAGYGAFLGVLVVCVGAAIAGTGYHVRAEALPAA
jgi:hypothetical protein